MTFLPLHLTISNICCINCNYPTFMMPKNLAENRHDFKDFFSCLTNIRCAVVEGGHHCEAVSQTLEGYLLGNFIPLQQTGTNVPQNSTLFRPIQTQVYYCQDENRKLDGTVLEIFPENQCKNFRAKK